MGNDTLHNVYTIERNKTLGRHVMATEKLGVGESILLEQPILIAASNNEIRCVNCFKLTESHCEKISKQKKILHNFWKQNHILSNVEIPSFGENISKIYEPIIKSGFAKYLRFASIINKDFLQLLCALIDVNAFEIRAPDGNPMKGLYVQGALLSHDCVANTVISIDNSYRMKIYASQEIEPGQITNCYINVLLGTRERRRILWESKYFHCNCLRCNDPTELNSHISSLLCSKCQGRTLSGYLVENVDAGNYQCLVCCHQKPTNEVNEYLKFMQTKILEVQDNINQLEKLLSRLSMALHPRHYLIVDVKQNIASLLRSVINDTTQCPGISVYERTIELCQSILQVLKLILPGVSRLKAITLYELASTQAEYRRLLYQKKVIDKTKLREYLQEAEKTLRESIRMLLYEPKATPEASTAVEGKLRTLGLVSRKTLKADEDAEGIRVMENSEAIVIATSNIPDSLL
uniref:SET domain-containing protein n=1 Tax=Glossina palpalis gambiensis TaxID=67801 RepID=A0A1B0BYW9_9MUSC